jgi:hypothetical protein
MPCGIGDSSLFRRCPAALATVAFSADALRHWRRVDNHLIEGSSMRVLDDRYSRDWGRLNLALRFLMHEARTRTICVWTGLTQDRIRSLYRDYMNSAGTHIPRHRGKSPQTVAYFTRSLRVQQETAVLASLLCLNGVVAAPSAAEAGRMSPGLARGALLCDAFEAYRTYVPSAQISFEHTIFLTTVLVRGDQLRLDTCKTCGSLVVVERFPIRDPQCLHCVGAPRGRR